MSKIVIGTLILAILIICSPFILRFFEKMYCYTFELGWLRGEKTKEEVVKKYMEGLKTGNSQTIERLIPKTHEADKEIREKIEKFQGADFSKVEIYYKETPFPAQAEIKNIKLENGETLFKLWDGAQSSQRLSFDLNSPLQEVLLDPSGSTPDIDPTNNSYIPTKSN